MSEPRFASITASLLARKGEARPWPEPEKQPLSWERGQLPPPAAEPGFYRAAPPPRPAPPPPPAAAQTAAPPPFLDAPPLAIAPPVVTPPPIVDWKKCSVRISHHDYERLGILAVKQEKSRQRLLQEAVDQLLGGLAQNFANGCACLGIERCPPHQT